MDAQVSYYFRTPVLGVTAALALSVLALASFGAPPAATQEQTGGAVVAWGDNSAGQSTVPPDLGGVKAIDAGGTHSLALVDNTPPTLSVSHTPDGTNGWNKTSPVMLTVSASDTGSGLAAAPPARTAPLHSR